MSFRAARNLYRQKRSTIDQYMEDILDIFKFVSKAKYLAPQVDTDESDDTDNGDNSTDDDLDGDESDDKMVGRMRW